MSLPQELVEHILSFLPSDESWRFPSLALVSRDWVSPVQTRLYNHLRITKRSWKRCRTGLQGAPHLRALVRTLEFCGDSCEGRGPPFAFAHLFPAIRCVIFGPNSLRRTVLDQLVAAAPQLRALRMVVEDGTWGEARTMLQMHPQWDELSLDLKSHTRWPHVERECASLLLDP
jgi:hypothetical protein